MLLKEFEYWVLAELERGPAPGRSYKPPDERSRNAGIITGTKHGTNPKRPNKRERVIAKVIRNLKRSDKVVVSTDKTNKWCVTTVDDYSRQMLGHLASDAEEVNATELVAAHAAGVAFITEDLFGELSEKEDKYLMQKLDSRRIATPKLLIKTHKEPLPDGSFPTRLVIPADGFMAGFGKMAFVALKKLFDFARNLSRADRETAEVCLRMLRFGMDHTFLQFAGKYYRYTGWPGSGDNHSFVASGGPHAYLSPPPSHWLHG